MNGCAKWYGSSRRCGVPVAWTVDALDRLMPVQPSCPQHLAAVISQVFSLGGITSVTVTKAEGPRS